MTGESESMSKSAKKRAAQKTRSDAVAAEAAAAAAPPPQPEPKAKAKAKAEPVAPAPKAKAKAAAPEPKAKAAAPEPKAKAKAKAEAAAPEPKAKAKAESKPKAESKKAASKPAAKPQAKPAVVEEAPPKKEEDELATAFFDDGSGGDWEVSSGLNKKQEKQRAKKEMEDQMKRAAKAAGHNPTIPKGIIPGYDIIEPPVAQAKVKAGAVAPGVAGPAAPAAAGEPEVPKDQKTKSIPVSDKAVGIIIGPKGATMNLIKEKTEIKAIDFNGGFCTITGSAKAVEQAETAILELTQKGYCSLAFEDFQENFVMVHPSYFPEIIGKKGAVIQALKKEMHVEVKLPLDVPKDGSAPPQKTYKVTVAGNPKNVEQAKEVIHHIMMYYHHESTHPGEVHEEMEVEPWQYSFLIGTKGSQLRHTQNNFHVKVHIPRETSLNPNVVVVGEASEVARAKASMEKIIWNASNAIKGRDRQDQADDGWGEDADEEDWMKPYLFKRR